MSSATSKLNISKIGRVCVTIADTDRAIDFYTGKLGFEKVVDEPMGPDMRWVEVAISGAETTIALAPPPPGQEAGVDVDDEVSRYGGPVPPMFWLRDPDGNSLIVVQPSS